MTARTIHPVGALQEWLDGRLDAERQAAVESHLAECARCRDDLDLLRAARDGVRAAQDDGRSLSGDLAFEQRMRAALDREDSAAIAPPASVSRARRSVWPLLAAAVVGLVAVLFASRWMQSRVPTLPPDLVANAVGELAAARDGTLVLDRVTERPEELEAYFARNPIGFPVRVLDLAMMGWRVTGGRVHRIGGRPSALYVYRDGGDHVLVCQMFLARLLELPVGAEHFARGTIPFAVYDRNGITAVFWEEGNVLCVLVSDLPRDAVIALATAKAMTAVKVFQRSAEPKRG